ncbi:MAG: hypothetical protein P4L51_25785 [Puia sp.]|nr:hypothetical protein [Puia sp.]
MHTIEKKSLKVGKYVNNDHVDSVIRTYKQERWVNNSNHIGKADSLSSWYSVEELEEFLETVKMNGGDGVRFYFGAYPADFTGKPDYAGRQTIVLVATRSKEVDENVINKDLYTHTDGKPAILAYNLGALCPPICPPPSGGSGPSGKAVPFEIGMAIVENGDNGMTLV